ncbi:MAG: hypothetical protein HQL33_01410 [Alphaproteobacteria bacterium]|nr:hypothetical protein [Alphaproteobacteria bacterium]MBF0128626.1 hypothetical protein [Alphaproteobacteria bacterium]
MENATDQDNVSIAEAKASALVKAALLLDQAKMNRDDKQGMVIALDNNLQLWVAIRTIARRPDYNLPDEAKENLVQLSHFVSDLTFKHGLSITDAAIDALVNINLRLAEGFLENIGEIHLDP